MKAVSKLTASLLLLAGLILATIIAGFLPGQADFTANKLYTLSHGSPMLLGKIEEPITLEFYFRRNSEAVPIYYKNYATRIEELLRQYVRAAGGRIDLHIIDPKPDTEEEESALRTGLSGQPLSNGDTLFFGLIVIQADQEETIPMFTMQREPFLEYDISRAIHNVQKLVLPRLGVISSLPVIADFQLNFLNPGRPQAQDWVFIQELRKSFDVEKIELTADEIPDGIDLLAVIHPQNLAEPTLFAIDQFLLSGKPVFIAVDPSSFVQKSQTPQQSMMMGMPPPASSSHLSRLFEHWDIIYDPALFVGDLQNASMIGQSAGAQPIRYPAWLSLDSLNSEAPPTATLHNIFLPETGRFQLKPESSLELTPLLTSSESSGMLSAGILNFTPPGEIARQILPTGEKFILAGIIRGRFSTAFPEGKPKPADDDDTAEEDEEAGTVEPSESTAHLLESDGPTTLILIADTDFLADQFSVEKINFLGLNTIRPLNDNLAFITNALEFLAGSEDLLSLRGRGSAIRPFKVVRDLEIKAQQRFQEEYDEVNRKLGDIQEKLRELLTRQGDQGLLVAGPEMTEAIKIFQQQETEFLAQRREIRKKLREDIENLNHTLALLNLTIVPALIGLFGIWFFTRRNKRF